MLFSEKTGRINSKTIFQNICEFSHFHGLIIRNSQLFVKEALPLKVKNTDELQQALMDTPDLERFLKENEASFKNQNLTQVLNDLLNKKNISKAELAKNKIVMCLLQRLLAKILHI